MSKKAISLATLVIGATLSMTGLANAEPNGDPTRYADFTAEFVNYTDPAAIDAAKNGKYIIVSTMGTSSTIACRGTGTDVPIYDCMQEDAFGWVSLKKIETPLGTAWSAI
ncbi:hypothetical protein NN3_08670 [Nocardia neocaledoniensis NBRC 108232]|uniref:SH3 domain-containing protein n=1 Tax=Nocardia neocaledoniensis TaxID=236511 RepID=A0A317NFT5_9NOCA|nr:MULTISPECIES: hypothetical protein [Nocardia]PWV73617.1 hypothetical protein DFR69_107244 [Nocardia neocaledoniensis]UGT58034.1 hypothetical protein LTT85_14870 [Nocardia asteroides]GEM29860.1 hypothetical protein NN3_08670 [Nocardia neocaledoniensis NBRC 108232]